jgi:hypothetical protein
LPLKLKLPVRLLIRLLLTRLLLTRLLLTRLLLTRLLLTRLLLNPTLQEKRLPLPTEIKKLFLLK